MVLQVCKVDPCGVCSLSVKANSVLHVLCGKWMHGRCAREKGRPQFVLINFTCRKFNDAEVVEQEEKL